MVDGPTTTTTTPPSTTTPRSTTTTTAKRTDALDWDGARYDFGDARSIDVEGSTEVIAFDRYQIYGDDGLIEGQQITEEPLIFANTDVSYQNEGTQLRRYRLAPDADGQDALIFGDDGSVARLVFLSSC